MLDSASANGLSFQPAGHPLLTGILTKYNRKSVTVITEQGQQWNVPPVFLHRPETSAGVAAVSAHDIRLPGKSA